MMKLIRRAVGLLFLAMVLVTPGPARAQTTSNGPYYATPAWDQILRCDAQATCPRFIVLSNWIDTDHPSGGAAVLDRETGLVWEQSPQTTNHGWSTSRFQCNSRTTGGRIGWRLPSVHELMSLADPNQSSPALPPGHPFSNVQSARYWSATTTADDPTQAWLVVFDVFAGALGGSKTSDLYHLWCVRGAVNADVY